MSDATGILRTRRIVVCVGPGGVGKTTVSAALAVAAARAGRRTVVLTIDPARRLAGALGLDGLSDELEEVPGVPGLRAAMLDTRSSYDALMRRVGGDEGAVSGILHNAVYRAFSRTLARSHAYVAFERLYDVLSDADLVVLDTPPTRAALDVLDAPGALVSLLDHGVVEWLTRPRRGGALSALLPSGSAAVGRLLSLLASRRLVGELGEFFRALSHLRDGFRERAATVRGWLASPETAFVLVAAPEATVIGDVAYLAEGLTDRGLVPEALVVNRAWVEQGAEETSSDAAERQRALAAQWLASGDAVTRAGADLRRLHDELAGENERRRAGVKRLVAGVPHRTLVQLPELERDPTSVGDLMGLASRLVAGGD